MTGSSEHLFDARGIPPRGDSDDAPDRYDLQERYIDLVRAALPHRARSDAEHTWPITKDHCFMRIVLDSLFQGCWYDHLDRRLVAYKQLSDGQLAEAIEIAEAIIEQGPGLAETLNAHSLAWRAKSPAAQMLAEKRSSKRLRQRRTRPPSPSP